MKALNKSQGENNQLEEGKFSSEQLRQALDMVDLSDLGLIVIGSEQKVLFWSQWMVSKSGLRPAKVVGKSIENIFASKKNIRLNRAIEDAQVRSMPSILSHKLNPHVLPIYTSEEDRKNRKVMSQMVTVKPLPSGKDCCFIQIIDVSSAMARDKMLRQQAIQSAKQALHTKAILGSVIDAVISTDENGRIDYLNKVAANLTGWSAQDAVGLALKNVFILSKENGKIEGEVIRNSLENGKTVSSSDKNMFLNNKSGSTIPIDFSVSPIADAQNLSNGVVVVFRDVTKERHLAEKMSWQASHDVLTSLFNRASFDRKLKEIVEDARHRNKIHTLLYLDLDQFKIVNDTCGHVAGDELLKQISALLEDKIRTNDFLARLGGDEFGILLTSCPVEVALRIGDELRQAVQDFRFRWLDNSFAIGVSIGVVEISSHSESSEKVLSEADAACYTAKDAGRNQVNLYQPNDSEAAQRHGEMAWFARIQAALDDNQFTLLAQKIVPTDKTDKKTHYEILIRLLEKDGNLVPPGAFIPAAERYGLMPAIDRWVISKVFDSINSQELNVKKVNYQFAINLSGATLSDENTLLYILEQIEEKDIPENMITFEITETAAISNLSAANHFMKTIRNSGCQFSLDDFGSGLSSFSYLKNLPVDILKIDGSFVKDMDKDPIDRAMVESINQIGHIMGLKTVAEFAENDIIIKILDDIGVDYIQGYGVSNPVPLLDKNGQFLL